MNIRTFAAPVLALTIFAVQPGANAEDKKKKKSSAEELQQLQLKQQQFLQQQAAQAAAKKRGAVLVAPQAPPVPPPQNIAPQKSVSVQIFNQTGQDLGFGRILPDGTLKNLGLVTANPKLMSSDPGNQWVFTAGGQIIHRYTVTNQKQQQLVIGGQSAQGGPAAPPVKKQPRPVFTPDQQAAVIALNAEREGNGLRPIEWSANVCSAAQQVANRVTAPGYQRSLQGGAEVHGFLISRTEPPAESSAAELINSWLQQKRVPARPALPGQPQPPQQFQQGYMYSQIMRPELTHVGFGFGKSASNVLVVRFEPN